MVKTITLKDDTYKFLVETARQLETQDNRHTAVPIYRIYEKIKVERASGNGDEIERLDYEGAELQYCDNCKQKLEDSDYDFSVLPPLDASDCDCKYEDGATWTFDIELLPAEGGYDGVAFLTEKAAEEYRKNNHYHFNDGGVVYAESAFRNWELIGLIDAIKEIGKGGDLA